MPSAKSVKSGIPFKIKITLIIFGLFLFFILLETGLRLGGTILLSPREYRNLQSIKHKGAYRVMCLGESTTQDQYPRFLEEELNQSKIGVHFSVIDTGQTGCKTSAILARLEYNLDKFKPDIAVAMIGINDFGPHVPYEEEATSRITSFLRSFKTYKFIGLLWLRVITKTREMGLKEDFADCVSNEKKFQREIELDPENYNAYIGLGLCYWEQGQPSRGAAAFKKAIELNPGSDRAYIGLGSCYSDEGKPSEAEAAFKQAIAVNPKSYYAYTSMGRFRYSQSELPLYHKAVELNPLDDSPYVALGLCYYNQGDFFQAEAAFKKAIELNPKNDKAYGACAVLNEETGKPESAEENIKKANGLRSKYYIPATAVNYRKIKEILSKRGIKLICVQYPMRSIEPLKKIFAGNAEGVIFVDNEKIFREAVKREGYKEYFIDIFGGDFGHCTDKGNRLLGGNIAGTILKEVFQK